MKRQTTNVAAQQSIVLNRMGVSNAVNLFCCSLGLIPFILRPLLHRPQPIAEAVEVDAASAEQATEQHGEGTHRALGEG